MARDLKIVVLGDRYVGKTSLLISYRTKKPPVPEYTPTVFDIRNEEYVLNNNVYTINVWDTAEQEEPYDKLRSLLYSNVNCFILCYAMDDNKSFVNVAEKWLPELRQHCPKTPIILVATKCDLRNVGDPTLGIISTKKGLKFAREMKAVYIECSMQNMLNIDEVVEAAVKVSVSPPKKGICTVI